MTRLKQTKREAEETMNKAQEILLHHDLKFFLPEYLDPLSRFYTRIALRHKDGWIPKQVLEYVKEKREKGESLKWKDENLEKVVQEDKFELVKWAVTFSDYVKENLCEEAATFGKLHMLKWAKKQEPPLQWNDYVLLAAFEFGHYDTVKWLNEKGCLRWNDVEKTDFLRYDKMLEDEEEWKNIDVNEVIFVLTRYSLAFTTLMMASHFGHTELVLHLLGRNGLNVNMENRGRKTSLLFACETGKLEVVKLLLEHKDINVNQGNNFGRTAFHLASERGHLEVAKAILSHPKFTNVNQADKYGLTALHFASREGHIEVVKALLSHPKFTNVNKADEDGKTALHLASRYGYNKVVKALLSHPKFTNVNEADEYGRTALHWACMGGHIECAKAILSHPKFTNVNQVSKDGETALHLASKRGHIEVVKALLSHPKFTNVNEADNNGQTALHWASMGGHNEVAKAILSHPKFTNVNQVSKD
eukprot:g4564.t1